jgi:tetratricopeptide (TPR) repeat protein
MISVAAVLALSACASPKLEIREVGQAHRDLSDGTSDGRVALGLTQLAMGNVGLALETFRRASREDPQNYRALQGLAECYLQLGKPAVARRSLEQALALRPDIPELYRALAAAAEGEGKTAEAAALRREAALRANSGAPSKPVPVAPVRSTEAAVIAVKNEPAIAMLDLAPERSPDNGPRLVRLSLGEVALMTRRGSPFAGVRHVADTTVHAPLRILNAARVQGIAARTRSLLASKGVGGADIGDAPARRQHSELRYSKRDATRAHALANKLPFKVMLVEADGPLTLLVGRNAAP